MDEEEETMSNGRSVDGVGAVSMVRSLSQRSLNLVKPAVQELLVTLLGVWAQMLLMLLASGHAAASLEDAASDQGGGNMASEEPEEPPGDSQPALQDALSARITPALPAQVCT